MITEDYISFETAKLLKEIGYCNVSTVFYKENGELVHYNVPLNNNGVSDILGVFYEAPTLQMAMKWIREVYNIQIVISPYNTLNKTWGYYIFKNFEALTQRFYAFKTYEEACEAAIKYCIEKLI